MESLYLSLRISRQAHFKAVKQELSIAQKATLYIGLMVEIRDLHPGMGLRKMYEQFNPEGIGRDSWVSLGLQEGFRLQIKQTPYKTTYPVRLNRYKNLLQGKMFTDVNQVWTSDIFYFQLGDRHYYGVLVMDVYSRKIIGHSIADNMRAENNINALSKALECRGIENYENKLIHHSDRGSQYLSDIYTELLENHKIRLSVCFDVLENAHCERVNGTIKNEYLNKREYKNFKELEAGMTRDIEAYNNRKHNTIKMTPNEFELHLSSIPEAKREKLSIFTINKSKQNPLQLELDFGS
jgi:hypothetical protein